MKKIKLRTAILSSITFVFILLIFRIPSFALEVKRSVLDNGLTLLIVERHNLPIVKVSLGINAGSLHEPEEKAGLASLAAGLLTEGTANRSAQEISEEIEFVGGSVGAGGGDDYVKASLSILKKDIDLGFDLLSDILLNPVFPEDEIEKKKERIKGGLKSREDDPGFVASRDFKKAVFGSHPYGRLVSGTEETLDRIKRDDLVEFHANYYVPNNAIMAVVGDVTAAEVEKLIKRYFSQWHAKKIAPLSLPAVREAEGRKTITVDKDLSQANIILGHIGVRRDDPDYYSVSVMNYILGGGGFASRLMKNIRDDKGLAYSIQSSFMPNRYGGRFQVVLQTKNESANIAIEEVLKEINKIRTTSVSESELADAQSFLTGSFPMRIENSSRIAGFLVAVEVFGLGTDYIDDYPSYINGVTREDVLRVAEKYLDPENYILVVVADQEKTALKEEYK
jgi:zinc protease